MRRLLNRALYAQGPACFACGRWGARPCPGHEYGGTILGRRLRRWAPWWLARHINPMEK
ncbi:hypothetical protein [Micromonospora carbonacea]|uniref:Uncharacterized protein n=1 Tax=Micromonospora carbonacea TaxID=47853 RepID=A0A1C5A9H2_9ACTN|nr:hypothetical protein [Micromonospora carbonacea]SCF41893.1 hypothetical protein GA0070563_11212 [Micromonospora carbonacea]